MKLIHGDCLEKMKDIESGSIDMILTDPPYGTAGGLGAGEPRYKRLAESLWDKCLPQAEINEECNRVLRTNGAMAIFSQEPFTSSLIQSAHNNVPFSYRLIWLKDHFANSLVVNKAPVNYTEDISLFFKKHTKHDFNGFHPLRPYAASVCEYIGHNKKRVFSDMDNQGLCHFMRHTSSQFNMCTEKSYDQIIELYCIDKMVGFREFNDLSNIDKEYRSQLIKKMTSQSPKIFNLAPGKNYKPNVLEYKKDYTGLHPTQKPVLLAEDLIKTYTNENQTVLDFTMGSGTTGVACKNLNREFIGIELDENYFNIAKERIENA